MVSLSRALFAASVALAATVGTTASVQDNTAAVVQHARAFGQPGAVNAPRLVSRFGQQPVMRRGRRCKPKSSAASGSAPAPSSSSTEPTSSSSSPKGSHAPQHNTHAHSKSQATPSSSPSSSSSHSASSTPKPSPSTTGGNHYASSKAPASSSKAPSSSSKAPSSSSKAPSSSSKAPAPSSSSASSGGSGGLGGILTGAAAGTHTGDLTYYATGLGACGWQNNDSEFIAAIGTPLWTQYGFSNSNKLCGHEISLTYNGKTIKVKAVDQCPGCAAGSLDLSPAAFQALGAEAEGRLKGATWHFIS